MALDNAKNGSRATAIRDTLLAAREFLKANPSECKAMTLGNSASKFSNEGCKVGKHGGSECIANFLGPKNYPAPTVREYTGIADDVIEHVVTKGSTHPERQDKIPLKAAVAISQLPTKVPGTGRAGKRYGLDSKSVDLSKHLGHQVTVTGTKMREENEEKEKKEAGGG